MENYIYDMNFLKQLDLHKEKQMYVRIISLNNEDFPRESLEGKTSGGSINIDGSSAVRRSCSLSFQIYEEDPIITDEFWCFNNKFKLEIGVKNNINSIYPEIIWFNMGIYVITSFSKSENTNNLNVSISGKDKMCRVNGEISGNLTVTTDFGIIETENENGDIDKEKIPLEFIIRNALIEYAQERNENIIIEGLDDYGLELLEYRGTEPMYIYINNKTKEIRGVEFSNFEQEVYIAGGENKYQLKELEEGKLVKGKNNEETNFHFYQFYENLVNKENRENPTCISFSKDEKDESAIYNLVKIEYGDTVGYHRTPMVYPTDLILNAGETVTSLLDKIKNLLGDFEYFYDLYGRFVFQKKKTYIFELFSPIDSNGAAIPTAYASPYAYRFDNEDLFLSISHSPNINNIKNDFSIWSTRTSISGVEIPIHGRYAIDKKPNRYKSYDGVLYSSEQYDWREIIYQMALDYKNHNRDSGFYRQIESNNPWFIDGRTGYEQYYTDLLGFWRQLYNPSPRVEETNSYYNSEQENKYWNKNVFINPSLLNFWFDFLDTEGELGKYSINKINYAADTIQVNLGTRTKVANENSVKAISFKQTPEILFVFPDDTEESINPISSAYFRFDISEELEEMQLFAISSQGLSMFEKINEVVYNHTTKLETLNLTTIPIYYLEPNTRIYISGYGDYTLDKISYSLNYNGTMSISGNKIIEQFY